MHHSPFSLYHALLHRQKRGFYKGLELKPQSKFLLLVFLLPQINGLQQEPILQSILKNHSKTRGRNMNIYAIVIAFILILSERKETSQLTSMSYE